MRRIKWVLGTNTNNLKKYVEVGYIPGTKKVIATILEDGGELLLRVLLPGSNSSPTVFSMTNGDIGTLRNAADNHFDKFSKTIRSPLPEPPPPVSLAINYSKSDMKDITIAYLVEKLEKNLYPRRSTHLSQARAVVNLVEEKFKEEVIKIMESCPEKSEKILDRFDSWVSGVDDDVSSNMGRVVIYLATPESTYSDSPDLLQAVVLPYKGEEPPPIPSGGTQIVERSLYEQLKSNFSESMELYGTLGLSKIIGVTVPLSRRAMSLMKMHKSYSSLVEFLEKIDSLLVCGGYLGSIQIQHPGRPLIFLEDRENGEYKVVSIREMYGKLLEGALKKHSSSFSIELFLKYSYDTIKSDLSFLDEFIDSLLNRGQVRELLGRCPAATNVVPQDLKLGQEVYHHDVQGGKVKLKILGIDEFRVKLEQTFPKGRTFKCWHSVDGVIT